MSADEVRTFHGSGDGSYRIVLVDGMADDVVVPHGMVSTAHDDDLTAALVPLLGEAYERHAADLLEAWQPAPAMGPDAVERYAATALADLEAELAASPSLRREVEEATVSHSPVTTTRAPGGSVTISYRDGAVVGIAFDPGLLATGTVHDLSRAVCAALNANVAPDADLSDVVAGWDEQQLLAERAELENRIKRMERR